MRVAGCLCQRGQPAVVESGGPAEGDGGAGRAWGEPLAHIRQVLTESVLLATLGGVLGVLVAYGGVHTLLAWNEGPVRHLAEAHVDARMLGFALFIALGTGVCFGVFPALQMSGLRLEPGSEGGWTRCGGRFARTAAKRFDHRGNRARLDVADGRGAAGAELHQTHERVAWFRRSIRAGDGPVHTQHQISRCQRKDGVCAEGDGSNLGHSRSGHCRLCVEQAHAGR